MKSIIRIGLFTMVFTALFFAEFMAYGQQAPQAAAPQTIAAALNIIGDQPITVADNLPADRSQRGGTASATQNRQSVNRTKDLCPHMQDRCGPIPYGYGFHSPIFGSRFPIGGVYGARNSRTTDINPSVFSNDNPQATLASLIQEQISQRLTMMGKNVLLPSTGPMADQLELALKEAGYARPAGFIPPHQPARYAVLSSYSIYDEKVEKHGFDGNSIAYPIAIGGWIVGNRTARDILIIGASVLSATEKTKERRTVVGVLRVNIVDLTTRQVLYSTEGAGRMANVELAVMNIGGYQRIAISQTNAEALAWAMVEGLFTRERVRL